MELIKKIKQAETQAQQIVDKAKADAAELAEKQRQNHQQALEEIEHQRRKAIEAAVKKAQSEALAQVENLKAQAEKDHQKLHEKTDGKMASATAKVIDYLKG